MINSKTLQTILEDTTEQKYLQVDLEFVKTSLKDAGKTSLNDAGKTSLNDAGKTSLNDAGKTSLNEHGKTSLNDAGKTSLNDAGKTSLNDAGKSSLNEHGKTSLSDSMKASLNDAGKTSLNDAGKSSLNDAGKTSLNEHGKTSLSDSMKASLSDAGKTSLNDAGKTSLNEPGRTLLNDAGKSSLNDAGKTSLNDAGKTLLNDAGTTSLNDNGKTSLNDAGKTSLNDAGTTSLNDTGKTSLNDAGKTSLNENGKTSLSDSMKASLNETKEIISILSKSEAPGRKWCYVPARYVLAFWSTLGLVNMFMIRTAINITILDMVKNGSSTAMTTLVNSSSSSRGAINITILDMVKNRSSTAMTTLLNGSSSIRGASHNKQPTTFQWSDNQQYLVLSAFYYGYCSTQILGGYASGRFGSKMILGMGLLVTSVLSLAMPFAAWKSYSLFVVCRVGQGLAQGLALPCIHTMWSKWAPENEKSILMTITYSGCQLGTILATLMSSYICRVQDQGGWQTVFFLVGAAGIIWTLFWLTLIYDTPQKHPRISQEERSYIEANIQHDINQEQVHIHWLKVIKSPALHAIIAAHIATDWGCFALMTCFPKYLKTVLKYDLTENGFLSSLPFVVLLVTNPMSGLIADRIRGRGRLSTKNTRKLVNSIGLLVPSGLTLAVCFLDGIAAVFLLVVAVGISGFTIAGYSVNHLDVAPAFAGTLFGITNTIGTTTGFIGPVILGALTKYQNSQQHWNTFFYITSGVFLIGGLLFLLFAQGEVQDWTSTTSECSVPDSVGSDNNNISTELDTATGCPTTKTSVNITEHSSTP